MLTSMDICFMLFCLMHFILKLKLLLCWIMGRLLMNPFPGSKMISSQAQHNTVRKASDDNSRPTSSQCDALRHIVSLSISYCQRKLSPR